MKILRLKTMYRNKKSVRQKAAFQRREMGDAFLMEQVEALDNNNQSVRCQAAVALGQMGKSAQKAVQALVTASRKAKKREFGRPFSQRAQGFFRASSNDASFEVPFLCEVAKALGRIGGVTATPFLIQELGSVYEVVSQHAADALILMGSAAVPFLIEALNDNDVFVRRIAEKTLSRMGTPEAMKAVEATNSRILS